MKITIETIPHDEQRYDTVGDWQWINDELKIQVSELGNWKHEALIAIHELVEALGCKAAGITTQQVDGFDMNWHKGIDELANIWYMEPGDDPNAPYYRQHLQACIVERMLAAELDINWQEYERIINEAGKLE